MAISGSRRDTSICRNTGRKKRKNEGGIVFFTRRFSHSLMRRRKSRANWSTCNWSGSAAARRAIWPRRGVLYLRHLGEQADGHGQGDGEREQAHGAVDGQQQSAVALQEPQPAQVGTQKECEAAMINRNYCWICRKTTWWGTIYKNQHFVET